MSFKLATFNAYLRANEKRAYCLGTWDCALFVFDLVRDVTGVDHLAEYRGRYEDYAEAERLMREIDRVASFRNLVDVKLGPRIPPAEARTGDVVSYGASVGFLSNGRGLFLAQGVGYERLQRRLIERAWRFPA